MTRPVMELASFITSHAPCWSTDMLVDRQQGISQWALALLAVVAHAADASDQLAIIVFAALESLLLFAHADTGVVPPLLSGSKFMFTNLRLGISSHYQPDRHWQPMHKINPSLGLPPLKRQNCHNTGCAIRMAVYCIGSMPECTSVLCSHPLKRHNDATHQYHKISEIVACQSGKSDITHQFVIE